MRTKGREITAVVTDKGDVTGDAYVLSLGVMSPHLVEGLGIRLPIYPVKGYSATLRITDPSRAPRLGGVDEENLLAYCPMGERLRLTATAEISGYSTAYRPPRSAAIRPPTGRPISEQCSMVRGGCSVALRISTTRRCGPGCAR